MREGEGVSLAELVDERRGLEELADRLTAGDPGSRDVVDAAYRRWFGLTCAERRAVGDPGAWLADAVRALAPRPAPSGPVDAPGAADTSACRVLREALVTLSPAERAQFVLNDVFGALPRGPRSRPVPHGEHDTVVHAVRDACERADAAGLEAVLAENVTALYDSGGKVRARTRPADGPREAARSLLTLLPPRADVTMAPRSVNGRTALLVHYRGRVAAIISLTVADGRATQLWVTVNPDKLRPWNRNARP
ncbi:hypothetical protein SRB5_37040 [Streptomyces sp. RB5]|uniref:RNA polymerase subunit sigma n=1 Tax=Streptomyces smaragdinus TaxID=2585196 RepID=A0A7K0CJD3_9ACTN|nr:RNA polymerase subunit sigma [Streptomyces smaragdinus]MQY13556.1 hypothetical protein [Streptomyces smaragdinus]